MFDDYILYLDGQVQRSREAREHWTALRGKKETRKKKKKTPAGGGGYADPRTEGHFRRISRFYDVLRPGTRGGGAPRCKVVRKNPGKKSSEMFDTKSERRDFIF
ncbi:hypothetical protein DIPPA_19971 [Diplonema papillatum]|nr:hypothetical protein DIPPA_19971 [Diplonema papillatum]